MSILVLDNWFVNQDRSIFFYDIQKYNEFATGKTKEIVAEEKDKTNTKNKRTGGHILYEHIFNPKGCILTVSTQITGYQISRKTKNNNILLLALGRRAKEDKKFLQTDEEIKIIFGLIEENKEENKE